MQTPSALFSRLHAMQLPIPHTPFHMWFPEPRRLSFQESLKGSELNSTRGFNQMLTWLMTAGKSGPRSQHVAVFPRRFNSPRFPSPSPLGTQELGALPPPVKRPAWEHHEAQGAAPDLGSNSTLTNLICLRLSCYENRPLDCCSWAEENIRKEPRPI